MKVKIRTAWRKCEIPTGCVEYGYFNVNHPRCERHTTRINIRTSDAEWAAEHGIAARDEGQGDGYQLVTVAMPADLVERVTFAGRDMVRFDLETVAEVLPVDHQRWAMYPATYVVA